MDTEFSEQDRKDNGECKTLCELLEMLAGGELMNNRHANYMTLMQAEIAIRRTTQSSHEVAASTMKAW